MVERGDVVELRRIEEPEVEVGAREGGVWIAVVDADEGAEGEGHFGEFGGEVGVDLGDAVGEGHLA